MIFLTVDMLQTNYDDLLQNMPKICCWYITKYNDDLKKKCSDDYTWWFDMICDKNSSDDFLYWWFGTKYAEEFIQNYCWFVTNATDDLAQDMMMIQYIYVSCVAIDYEWNWLVEDNDEDE